MGYIITVFLVVGVLLGCKQQATPPTFSSYKVLDEGLDSLALLRFSDLDSILNHSDEIIVLGTSYSTNSKKALASLREGEVDFKLLSMDYPSTQAGILAKFKKENPELLGLCEKIPTQSDLKKWNEKAYKFSNYAIISKSSGKVWVDLDRTDFTTKWWK